MPHEEDVQRLETPKKGRHPSEGDYHFRCGEMLDLRAKHWKSHVPTLEELHSKSHGGK